MVLAGAVALAVRGLGPEDGLRNGAADEVAAADGSSGKASAGAVSDDKAAADKQASDKAAVEKVAAGTASDPLPAGSRWEGTFEFLPDGSFSGQAALRVESRTGLRFAGVYSSEGEQYAWKVRGTAGGGRIAWEFIEAIRDAPSEDVVGQVAVEGTIAGDAMSVMWRQGDEQAQIDLRRVK
jgi:hypothetical protein